MLSVIVCNGYKQFVRGTFEFRRTSNISLCLAKASTSCGKPEKSKSDQCGVGASKGGGVTKHQITYKPYEPPCFMDHDRKNMGLGRPMSPHLTIQAPTVSAMTSILERITGIILSFYAVMISCGTLFLSNGIDSYVSMIQSLDLSRPLILILKLIFGFPFAYHYFFGIRFIAWNAGRWLSIKQVNSTAKQMAIAAAVVTVLFAFL